MGVGLPAAAALVSGTFPGLVEKMPPFFVDSRELASPESGMALAHRVGVKSNLRKVLENGSKREICIA
jgi:hypothetical protein